jgi:hypothetical protein
MNNCDWWQLELEGKPEFDKAMRRIYAWYQQEVIDRPPIRFSAHNADFTAPHLLADRAWPDRKARWFDAEFQVDFFIESIRGQKFLAETFPVFWPNLGPEVYSAFHGSELIYQDVTSYSVPLVKEWDDVAKVRFDRKSEYFQGIEKLTTVALEKCEGRYLVGYTDLHGGVDCAAAWRDPQQLCIDLLCEPERVQGLVRLATAHFQEVFDYFDAMLKARRQLSVTWMGIPAFGKLHIPSCDFAAMIATRYFEQFCLPVLVNEVKPMSQNIFHLDGKGMIRHLDLILQVPEINAIQWVQGMGLDTPIMQWVPLLKRIRAAGKSLVIDLQLSELEDFIGAMEPEGLLLCIAADEAVQPDVIRRVEKW